MAEDSMPVAAESLNAVLDRLADFESDTSVVSLYLDLTPEPPAQSHQAFLTDAAKEFPGETPAFERIRAYLETEKPSAQALAIFASSGEEGALFEAVPLETTIGHRLYIDREPHVFPLERLADQFQSYAALLVNTNAARLSVFSVGAAERQITVRNKKGKRVAAGGWSQARYQRRVENLHTKHMKEVADALETLVRDESIARVLVAGDSVALPLLREHLSPATLDLLTDLSGVDIKTPEAEVFRVTLDAFREVDQQSDKERVDGMLDAYRARGLATVGIAGVKAALERGQVDRLLVPATPAQTVADHAAANIDMDGPKEQRSELDESVIEELVTLARRTDAEITFIEDARLLEPAKGVGAMLRFRV
jgi:peptide subunit release factor 1 (eRF1)